MYKSIQQFIENNTKEVEKKITKFLLQGNMLRFEEGLMDDLMEFGRNIYQEILESIEETIRNSEFRKQQYYVEHKADNRTLLTRFGTIEVTRAYYTDKKTGKGVYLLDKYVGIDSNDKVSQSALAHALTEAVETSYRKGGEEACMTSDVITKQTVKKAIHNLEVEIPDEIPTEKKRIKNLHIQADEDHVSLQFFQQRGDLTVTEQGRKYNTAMPKLILLYEDMIEEGKPGSKRYKLTGKKYFGGIYEGSQANEDLWMEVQQYIYDHYDTEYLENVYLAGDGAPWIVSGCQVLEKSKFVLDKFHLWKYISTATNHLLDSTEDARELIYEAINERNLDEVGRLLRKCAASAETEGKQREIENCYRYIQNNWLGIMVRLDDGGAVWGCSMEGHISHVYSARESSRPLGWSKKGVDKISRLRVYTRNGGNILNLMEYQHEKQQQKKRIENQDAMVREVKKHHQLSGEEIVRKEIPGLEAKEMTWMRNLIYRNGIIA